MDMISEDDITKLGLIKNSSIIKTFFRNLNLRYILTVGWPGIIKLWDLKYKRVLSKIEDFSCKINCILYFPDIKFASGGNGEIKIWCLKSLKCLNAYKLHSSSVTCLLDLDKGKVASGSSDKLIKIWLRDTGEVLTCFEGHTGRIRNLISLGEILASSGGTLDNTLRLWNVESGSIHTINHGGVVLSLVNFTNGNFASASSDSTIRIWCSQTYQCLKTIKGSSDIHCIIKFDENTIVGTTRSPTILVCDIEKGTLSELKCHTSYMWGIKKISKDKIITGSSIGELIVWDVKKMFNISKVYHYKVSPCTCFEIVQSSINNFI
jgi:WD40 repeat protein